MTNYDIVKSVEDYYTTRLLIICGVLLVIMLICGLIARAIVKSKGFEKTAAWFFCGFFLGFIGVIIAAVQQDKRPNGSYYPQYPTGAPPQQPYQQAYQPQEPYQQAYQRRENQAARAGASSDRNTMF